MDPPPPNVEVTPGSSLWSLFIDHVDGEESWIVERDAQEVLRTYRLQAAIDYFKTHASSGDVCDSGFLALTYMNHPFKDDAFGPDYTMEFPSDISHLY